MRIMIVTDQYPPTVGGVPTVTRALATGLAGRGHQVAVLAPSPGPRGAARGDGGARVRYRGSLPWPFYPGLRVAPATPGGLRPLVTGFRPDVVHVHSPMTLGLPAWRAARQAGIPVVYTNHFLPVNLRPAAGRRPASFDALFYAFLARFANRCSLVTAPSPTALRLLHEHGLRAPSRVISNGTDIAWHDPGAPAEPGNALRRRYGLRAGAPVILSVGRLSPEKRLDIVLDAAARLTGDAQVVIAGGGPQEAALRARAATPPLAGRVTFTGFVPAGDLPGLYQAADIFAIASEAELQSLTTMDAMASGLPVVAADAGALADLVRHGHSGLLFRPGRAAEMAACLDQLAGDPGLRRRMAAVGLAVIRGHDLAGVLAAWESAYGGLVAGGPGPAPQASTGPPPAGPASPGLA